MTKSSIVGLKELRENTEHYIRAVGKGKSFTVVRRSRPIFTITPPIDEDDERFWKTRVDFTKIRSGGVPINEIIAALERLEARDKKAHEPHRKKSR